MTRPLSGGITAAGQATSEGTTPHHNPLEGACAWRMARPQWMPPRKLTMMAA